MNNVFTVSDFHKLLEHDLNPFNRSQPGKFWQRTLKGEERDNEEGRYKLS